MGGDETSEAGWGVGTRCTAEAGSVSRLCDLTFPDRHLGYPRLRRARRHPRFRRGPDQNSIVVQVSDRNRGGDFGERLKVVGV